MPGITHCHSFKKEAPNDSIVQRSNIQLLSRCSCTRALLSIEDWLAASRAHETTVDAENILLLADVPKISLKSSAVY